MSGNFKNQDLRVIKTRKALIAAIIIMLNCRNFNQITVNDLCEEALISRAAFYTHFTDKYDLLKYLLKKLHREINKDVHKYEDLETTVNHFIYENKKIISNILKNANHETLEIVQDFMSSILDLIIKRKDSNAKSHNHTVLFNFCVGGLMQLLLWQVKNDYPQEVDMVNTYLYNMLDCITEWDAKQEQEEINRGGLV